MPATPSHVEPAPVKEGNEQPHTKEPQPSPPSYSPVTGETVPGQPVDPDLDIGGPLPNYHDQAEVVVRRPLQEELDAPIPLHKLVDTSKIPQRRLAQQSEIDLILKEIEMKILRQVHLPTSFRDLHAAYLNSPQFKDVYTYLLHHKIPSNPRKHTQVLAQASDYMVIDQLLFKITRDRITQKFKPLLCIPTLKINLLLHYFHSSLLGGHMGITKMYVTISQRFFCPNLAHHIRAYIVGCHICQVAKQPKDIKRPFQKCINIGVLAMCKVSMDIKHMPLDRSPHKYKYILVMLCEVSNFMVTIPLKDAQTKEICTGINKFFIRNYGPPTHIVCDQATSFLSSLAQAFFHHYGVRIITVSPTNHQSLLAEHGIKSLAEILKCHLAEFGSHWSEFLDFEMLAYNTTPMPVPI